MIVFIEGKKITIKEPRPATLAKYGLSLNEWKEIITTQWYLCPICKRTLQTPVIDHLHVRNWRKMKSERRKQFVRGIPCNYCNRRRLAKGMNLEIARNIVEYLERFEKRKPK
jgi:DNA-directed RNA polymerase subunit RPC12/RpoP